MLKKIKNFNPNDKRREVAGTRPELLPPPLVSGRDQKALAREGTGIRFFKKSPTSTIIERGTFIM